MIQPDFKRETLREILPDMLPLARAHYEEISEYKEFKFDPNLDQYGVMEQLGCLRIYTARLEGKLLGYAVFILGAHHHYQSEFKATHDLLFIDANHRGFGLSFMDFYERELKLEGVNVIYMAVTTQFDFSPILKRKNYTLSEWIYSKVL